MQEIITAFFCKYNFSLKHTSVVSLHLKSKIYLEKEEEKVNYINELDLKFKT